MKHSDLLAFLRHYNRWRQGDAFDQPSPAAITEALEAACTLLDQLERWREVAQLLAFALQAPHLSQHPAGHAYHARGTALEAYERLKNGSADH